MGLAYPYRHDNACCSSWCVVPSVAAGYQAWWAGQRTVGYCYYFEDRLEGQDSFAQSAQQLCRLWNGLLDKSVLIEVQK